MVSCWGAWCKRGHSSTFGGPWSQQGPEAYLSGAQFEEGSPIWGAGFLVWGICGPYF